MSLSPEVEAQLRAQQDAQLANVDPRTAAALQGTPMQPPSIMPVGGLVPAGGSGPPSPSTLPGSGATPADLGAWNSSLYAGPRTNLVDYKASGGSPPPPDLPAPPKPIGYTKAGYVPASRTTTKEEGVKFSPETQGELEKAQKAKDEHDAGIADALKEQQAEEGARAYAEYRDLQQNIADEQTRKAKQETARTRAWDGLMAAQKDLSKAQAQGIDPNRYLHNMGAGSKILTFLGLFASGFASGMTGKPNDAMEFLKSEISNDVNAQRDAIAGKERAYGDRVSLYGMLRQHGMDEDTAATGARLLYHQSLQKKLEAEYATARDAQTKLRYEQILKDNATEMAKLRGSFDEKASAKVQTSQTEHYAPAQPIYANAGIGKIHVPIGEQGQIVHLRDGRLAHVGDVKVGATLQEMQARTELAHRLGDQIVELDKSREAHVPGTAAYKKLTQMRNDFAQTLVAQHGAAKGIGAIRSEEEGVGADAKGARGGGLGGHEGGGLSGIMGAALDVAVPGRNVDAIKAAVKTADSLYEDSLVAANPRIVTGGRPVEKKGGSAFEYDVSGETYRPRAAAPGTPKGFKDDKAK